MLKGIASRAFGMFALFTIVCGLAFTLVVTGVAQLLFPHQANGSLITVNGVTYGSELIGQDFNDMDHMWGRIQNPVVVESPDGELAMYSGASNDSPASSYDDAEVTERFGDSYEKTVAQRVEMIKQANPDADMSSIPVDLVTSSGSGLDPHISVAAAEYQIPRLVQETGKSEDEIRRIVDRATTGKLLGIFGEKTVNVLEVNLMLEGILPCK